MQITTSATSISSLHTFVESIDSVAISLSADHESRTVLITVTPPKQPVSSINDSHSQRAPLDICCVIDVSGSMGFDAPIPGVPAAGGQVESTGLSVLDVVKHSLRTIISTMKDGKHNQLVFRAYQGLL